MPITDYQDLGYNNIRRIWKSPNSMLVSAGAVGTLDITGLKGKAKEYQLTGNIYLDEAATDTYLGLRINNDSGNNYITIENMYYVGSGVYGSGGSRTTGQGLLMTGINLMRTHAAAPCHINFKTKITTSGPNNNTPTIQTRFFVFKDTSNYGLFNTMGIYNVDVETTQLNLLTTNAKTVYGRIELYERVANIGNNPNSW